MNDTQKMQIRRLRNEGKGYLKISKLLGLSASTVQSFCRREGLNGFRKIKTGVIDGEHFCLNCGVEVPQNKGRKEKKFCSDYCRMRWWNTHQEKVDRKANYDYVCKYCGKKFTVYGNSKRKYCSHWCYIYDRFGGEEA